MNNLIEKFYTDKPVGECKNNEFIFGNLHTGNVKCDFCKDSQCHYNGDCPRQKEAFSGWDVN